MNRRERAANQTTWSVIIGVLLGVILFLGAAYSRQPLAGLIVGLAILVYMIVLSVIGRINVFHVLWGETIDEDDVFVNRPVILRATTAVAAVAIGILLYDVLSAEEWGWFSWVAALIAAGYLIMQARNARQSARKPE
jgi:hypothetical protein